MAKLIIEINEKPKEGDIIIYKNGKFTLMSGAKFLDNVFVNATEIVKLKDEVKDVKHNVSVILGEED